MFDATVEVRIFDIGGKSAVKVGQLIALLVYWLVLKYNFVLILINLKGISEL